MLIEAAADALWLLESRQFMQEPMDERPSWERESERASRLSAGSDDRELAAQRGCLNWLYLLSPLRSPADLQELFTDPQGFLLRWIIWLLILALGLWWIIRWLIGLLA